MSGVPFMRPSMKCSGLTNKVGRQVLWIPVSFAEISVGVERWMKIVECSLFLFAGIVACSAASPAEPLKVDSPFNQDELKFVLERGKASISGRAVLELADGSLKDCAGFNVEMLPVTAYSSERIIKTYGNVQRGQILLEQNPPKFVPDVQEYHELLLKSSCNAEGVFHFENVPAGDYFVMAFLIWEEKAGDAVRKTGGAVMQRLRVGANDRVAIEMGARAPGPR
jgi:hypothetical protein